MKSMVSFSGGKDSTAMLLRMIELKIPIDKIVFADTLFEFPELYDYIKKIEKHIGMEISILEPQKHFAGNLIVKNNIIQKKLKAKSNISYDHVYPEHWVNNTKITTFEYWFYGCTKPQYKNGKLLNEKSAGKQRGFPKVLSPCYYTREAKVNPLSDIGQFYDNIYIGIAYDEEQRIPKKPGKRKFPLYEWKWTEQDCIDYLNEKGLFNPLYVNFNRLGCWLCPKQNTSSLYVLWKIYPKLWLKLKWWDLENRRVTGNPILINNTLEYYENKFKDGKIPSRQAIYDCWNGCESVKKAFSDDKCSLDGW